MLSGGNTMKKIISTTLILLYLLIPASFEVYASSNESTITKIENDIYGFDFSKDSLKNRAARLEKTIYGQASTGDLNKRIKKLSADISADVIGLEIPPVEDTFAEEEKLAEDSSVNYPVVDEIEQKIFNQTYKNRDFHSRIVAIERKLFGKIYDVEDYSTRMDRIKAEVMPDRLVQEKQDDSVYIPGSRYYDDNALSSSDIGGLGGNRFGMPFGQRNYSRPYVNYGDMTGGAAVPQSSTNLSDELAQLEYETFGTSFAEDNTTSRIKRLNSANKAQKSSSRYDSYKFSQRMSTAMEIGAMILMILAMVL